MAGYIGARSVSLSTTVANAQDVTATDTTPEVTIINNTHEDTDGGREGKVIFKGQQSGGEESTLAEIEANHSGSSDDEKGQLVFKTNDGNDGATPTEAMRINSLGNVGIGTASVDVSTQAGGSGYKALQIESDEGGQLNFDHNDAGTGSTLGQINFQRAGEVLAEIEGVTDGATDNGRIAFRVQPDGGALGEVMRIDHTGNVMIGHTSQDSPVDNGGAGVTLRTQGVMLIGGTGTSIYANREDSDGTILEFRKDGSAAGVIGTANAADLYLGNSGTGLLFAGGSNAIIPNDPSNPSSTLKDDVIDLGHPSYRFDDIYATNSSIQTSDENEKQNIASLTNAEITAATAISKLFKTFKWKSKVTAKGDDARTHTGVIAQQVQTAMSDAGLDASKYAFWCSNTWWTKDGNHYDIKNEAPEGATEHTRMGIRYAELLAFIGAATEQRLTSIESRLTALEAE